MKNLNNRRRAFAELVTVDAWHAPFDGRQRVDLFADVVFHTARLGGEDEAPVRFRLKIKRAEIVVVIPETEPVGIEKLSIAQDSHSITAHLSETQRHEKQAKGAASLGTSLSEKGGHAQFGLDASISAKSSDERTIKISGEVPLLGVTLSRTAEGQYRWSVESNQGKHLEGRPWSRTGSPRMRLIDLRKDKKREIPPTVRVEVRCKREDLLIEDVVVKQQRTWFALKKKVGFRNRLAAAESYIREKLTQEGLEAKNLGDVFGDIALASIIAESAS